MPIRGFPRRLSASLSRFSISFPHHNKVGTIEWRKNSVVGREMKRKFTAILRTSKSSATRKVGMQGRDSRGQIYETPFRKLLPLDTSNRKAASSPGYHLKILG